jgi:hypothetical protein
MTQFVKENRDSLNFSKMVDVFSVSEKTVELDNGDYSIQYLIDDKVVGLLKKLVGNLVEVVSVVSNEEGFIDRSVKTEVYTGILHEVDNTGIEIQVQLKEGLADNENPEVKKFLYSESKEVSGRLSISSIELTKNGEGYSFHLEKPVNPRVDISFW